MLVIETDDDPSINWDFLSTLLPLEKAEADVAGLKDNLIRLARPRAAKSRRGLKKRVEMMAHETELNELINN